MTTLQPARAPCSLLSEVPTASSEPSTSGECVCTSVPRLSKAWPFTLSGRHDGTRLRAQSHSAAMQECQAPRWPGRPGLRHGLAPGPRPQDTQGGYAGCRDLSGEWQSRKVSWRRQLWSRLQEPGLQGGGEGGQTSIPTFPAGTRSVPTRSGPSCGGKTASERGGERAPLKFRPAHRHRLIPFHGPLETPNRQGGKRARRWGQRRPAQGQLAPHQEEGACLSRGPARPTPSDSRGRGHPCRPGNGGSARR